MKLIVILPAFNEEKTIGDVIRQVPKQIPGVSTLEVVVIDDGSTDKTKDVAISSGAFVLSHTSNMGVGVAFHTGIQAALKRGADIIVNIDADGQFNPQDIPVLIQPLMDGRAEFVTASRFIDRNLTPKMSRIKIWGNKGMSRLISFLTGQKFHDVSCGFRAYCRDAALRLTLFGRFTYTQETFLDFVFKGISIVEVPLKVRKERPHGKSTISTNLWAYAVKTIKIIFRAFRDYKPLKFFSIISFPLIFIGISLEVFLLIHYLLTGGFSPHKWAGFTGLGLLILGLIFFILGLIADMLDRIRLNQEELLYFTRKEEYRKPDKISE